MPKNEYGEGYGKKVGAMKAGFTFEKALINKISMETKKSKCDCGHLKDKHFFGVEEHCKEFYCKCERFENTDNYPVIEPQEEVGECEACDNMFKKVPHTCKEKVFRNLISTPPLEVKEGSKDIEWEERFEEFFWNEEYDGSAQEIMDFIKKELSQQEAKIKRDLRVKCLKMQVHEMVGVETGYDEGKLIGFNQALDDIKKLLSE